MPRHKSLVAGRWQELSLVEQMGNIGSEVGRTLNAKDETDKWQLQTERLSCLS